MQGLVALFTIAVALVAISTLVYRATAKAYGSRLLAVAVAAIGGPIAVITIAWTALVVWVYFQDRTGPIPKELQLAKTELVEESGGLLEGCGVLIFKLTEASKLDLQRQGIAMLQNARKGRAEPGRHQYDAWKAMPVDFSPRGVACVNVSADVEAKIFAALKTAYVTKGYEFDLFVDPISGMVVYSYNG